ncbi:MAG: signal peptide peptidase SppA [Candidatus Cloacimonadota bacterium]
MKKNTGYLLLGLVIFLVLAIGAFWLGYTSGKSFMGTSKQTVAKNSWLLVNPSGLVKDYNEVELGGFWGGHQTSVEDMNRRIRSAAKDKNIKGILLEPSFMATSYSSVRELVLALQDFRSSGKPVIAFGSNWGQRDYFLSLAADSIYMDPSASAGLLMDGVSANVMFYKEMLDKIGVKMHVLQSGEFKGAGEPYSQTSLSAGTRANLERALRGRYDVLLDALAKSRGITAEAARQVFEERADFFVSGNQALEMKLVDGLCSKDELLDRLGIKKANSIEISKYSEKAPMNMGSQRIAIINLNGEISPSASGYGSEGMISAAKVQSIIEDIEEDSSIKAVVLRVNSPGGSALESELIYRKLSRLKARIPIVVSMNGVAASGGYYISCASNYIFADEMTITGSIGVIMMIPEASGLGRKIGLRSESFGYGKFAGKVDPLNPYDPEFIASLRRNSTGVYTEFKQRVMDARGISPEEIEAVAEGRVFSAADAKENKLIDEIGGLKEAVAKAAELAKLTSYQVQNYPGKKNFYELLMEMRDNPMFAASLLHSQELSPEALAKKLVETLSARQWLYYLPYNME